MTSTEMTVSHMVLKMAEGVSLISAGVYFRKIY